MLNWIGKLFVAFLFAMRFITVKAQKPISIVRNMKMGQRCCYQNREVTSISVAKNEHANQLRKLEVVPIISVSAAPKNFWENFPLFVQCQKLFHSAQFIAKKCSQSPKTSPIKNWLKNDKIWSIRTICSVFFVPKKTNQLMKNS